MTGTSLDGTTAIRAVAAATSCSLILRFFLLLDSCAPARFPVRLEVAGTVGWQAMIRGAHRPQPVVLDVHGARGLCADCQLQLGRDQDVIDMLTPREDACVVDPAYPYLRAAIT
jgi:hypothetical protein